MPSVENEDLYGEKTFGLPPYGTPPPFPSHVFVDGAKRPTPEVEAEMRQALASQLGYDEKGTNLDEHRIDVAIGDADVVLDPAPLGDITVVVSGDDWKTFKAPVKALKSPAGDLVIVTTVDVEDGMLEWPVATFQRWLYVFRNDYVV